MLYKKFLKSTVFISFILIFTLGCFLFAKGNKPKYAVDHFKKSNLQTMVKIGDNEFDVQMLTTAETLKSGPTTNVPWEANKEFIDSKAKNQTPVMMAAYRTVLRDPLPGEEENVHLAARSLAGTVIKPGEVFSQNSKLGPYVESRGYKKGPTYMGTTLTTTIGGGVCKIASTLYNVTILSNLLVEERSAHSMPVPYVPYGQDATVSYGNKDYRFRNNTNHPIMIWSQGVDNILYIAFYGNSTPPRS